MKKVSYIMCVLLAITSITVQAQKSTIERINVYSHALEGNLIKDPAEREVTVYLPPSYIIEQYIPNLKKLKAIGMDAGLQDQSISSSTKKLHELLDSYDIKHVYESYEGDHVNRIGERIQTKTLPFFSQHLSFD